MTDIELRCAQYLKSDKGFKRMMELLRDKYINTGKLAGSIRINNLSREEAESLSGLLRKNYYNKDNISISISKISNAFDATVFAGADLQSVINGYFGRRLISHKELKSKEHDEKYMFFDEILLTVCTQLRNYLVEVFNDKTGGAYKLILSRYADDRDLLKIELDQLSRIIEALRDGTNYMQAMLSSKITGDPHSLDDGKFLSKMLIYYYANQYDLEYPSNAEERNLLMFRAGIKKDDISNCTATVGLRAIYKGSGKYHEGWDGFCDKFEINVVTLKNLQEISRIIPSNGQVYIFENPTVFAIFAENQRYSSMHSVICSNGQVRASTLALLDMLCSENCRIFYQGDFDPEGLVIVDKLIRRCKGRLELYNYDIRNYHKSLSDKDITDKRLRQLDSIRSGCLKILAEEMLRIRKSGYQESLYL